MAENNRISFIMAPMAEISHRAMRELVEGFGACDEYFTEMISAPALLGDGPFEHWYLDNGPCHEKLVYQVLGADIEHIVKAAALLDSRDCRGIDINMGCCAPLIRKTGAGIAWMIMPSPEDAVDRAGELIKKTRKQVKKRLSVKLRTGLNDDFDFLLRFCRRLEEEGVDLITLHPRTSKEKLKRTAKWSYVGALQQELSIPVAGNGDISSAEDLILRAQGPCDAVMVGRAAVKQPWIFAEARKNSFEKRFTQRRIEPMVRGAKEGIEFRGDFSLIEETGLRFLELLARYQPPEFHISRARRFFSFFCDNLKWGNYVKNLINRENTLSGIEQAWKEYFEHS